MVPSSPTVDTLLLQLSLDCCWHSKRRDVSSGQSAARAGWDHGGGSDVGAHTAGQDLLQQASGVHALSVLLMGVVGRCEACPPGAMALEPSREVQAKVSRHLCSAWGLLARV